MTPYAQRTIRRALNILERLLREPGAAFTTSSSVRNWLRLQLTQEQREEFSVLWLDNQHRLIADTLFLGTINTITVHPREIVKAGLKHNAAAAVLAHNHPSGLRNPAMLTGR
jgi:DNA repair protein RadC